MKSPSYWLENLKQSYDLATKHGGIAGFVAPLLTVILSVAGVSAVTQNRAATAASGIGVGLVAYFIGLMLLVTPRRMWRDAHKRTISRLAFVESPDNSAFDERNFLFYERVTVQNLSATAPLTNVEVLLQDIAPRPADFMTVSVPLHPMHASNEDGTLFHLTPLGQRTIDVAYFHGNQEGIELWHAVPTVPTRIPDGSYRLVLVARANETTPIVGVADLEVRHDDNRTSYSMKLTPIIKPLSSSHEEQPPNE
jgi:hypothetical protein